MLTCEVLISVPRPQEEEFSRFDMLLIYMKSNGTMTVNLKIIRKEATVAHFKILLQNLLGRTGERKKEEAENGNYFFRHQKQEF